MSRKVKGRQIVKALRKIASGMTLMKICEDPEMPTYHQLSRILTTRYTQRYADAKKLQGDHYFDQIIDLNQGMDNKNAYVTDKKINNLKWIAARRNAAYASKANSIIIDQSKHLNVSKEQVDEKKNRLRLAAQRIMLSRNTPIDVPQIDIDEEISD